MMEQSIATRQAAVVVKHSTQRRRRRRSIYLSIYLSIYYIYVAAQIGHNRLKGAPAQLGKAPTTTQHPYRPMGTPSCPSRSSTTTKAWSTTTLPVIYAVDLHAVYSAEPLLRASAAGVLQPTVAAPPSQTMRPIAMRNAEVACR